MRLEIKWTVDSKCKACKGTGISFQKFMTGPLRVGGSTPRSSVRSICLCVKGQVVEPEKQEKVYLGPESGEPITIFVNSIPHKSFFGNNVTYEHLASLSGIYSPYMMVEFENGKKLVLRPGDDIELDPNMRVSCVEIEKQGRVGAEECSWCLGSLEFGWCQINGDYVCKACKDTQRKAKND